MVAVPAGSPGLSGEAEAAAFERLPPPPEREVERVAHLVLMQLLPALVEADLAGFGAALTEIQRVTGAWFAPEQGGVFAPGPSETLVRRMAEWGAAGVGQSSWGPAVYGLTGERGGGPRHRGRAAEAGGSGRAGFRGGIRGGRGPGLAVRNWPEPVIDSSFCTMYTGPSKPPAVGDLTDVDGPSTGARLCRESPGVPWTGNP